MVWSLFYSSLVSIANGIKDGRIQNPHMLPPKLRQRVLDTVLQRDLINDVNCMALLSSAQFLNGIESFGTEHGGCEMEFLERLETSMATMLPNGETVGAGIKKLNLSVYGSKVGRGFHVMEVTSYPMVARLIAQCPNATSLNLCGIKMAFALMGQIISRRFPSILNKDNVCNSVMENLVDLSLHDLKELLRSSRPMVNFKQLTTLKLENCSLQFDIWPKFLTNVPTLQNLHMIDVNCVEKSDDLYDSPVDAYGLDWILPVSMPHLKSLEVVSSEHQFIRECNKAFVDNLMGCTELRRVHLSLDQNSTDEESLVRLASMEIDLKVKARFSDWNRDFRDRREYKIDAALDSSSKFKIVSIFHEKIDSFELFVWLKWMPEYTTALKDAINSCSNLTTFSLHIPQAVSIYATDINRNEDIRFIMALLHLFGKRERAMQVKDLRLSGDIDVMVVSAVFDWCLNLDRLELSHCSDVRDQHLIDWVSNGGGQLKHLHVFSCRYVTSEGIIPVLAKSGEGLLSIYVRNQVNDEGRNWETMLNNLCPHAQLVRR